MILGPLKPSARWCFVAAKLDFGSCLLGSTATFRQGSESNVGDSGLRPATPAETYMVFRCGKVSKLDFGSCLLGSIPHTSAKLNCQKHGAFQVDGWTWDIASFAVLWRIFRGSFAKFGCQKSQVQILNLNWALATVFNALYNPSCDTRLPQLRPKASTIPPVPTSRPFPLVHSYWTKQTIWNILNFSFATFREANYFRDLSRPSISLSRKWCSITPLHKQYIEVFFVAHLVFVQ